MDEGQSKAMRYLESLVGTWRGQGLAEFPTIPTFEYREELVFAGNGVQPLLRYEQRTWRKGEDGKFVPSQWETGFWRVLGDDEIEIVCAQGSGRVEVMRGNLTQAGEGFRVRVHSLVVANDARMDKTAREFVLEPGRLQYSMRMSTTAVPDLTLHVRAELRRGEAS